MGQWGHKKQQSKLCSSFKAPPTLKSYLSAQIAPRIPMGPQLHPFIIIAESIRMHIYQSKNLKLNFWVTSSCSRHRWQMANIIIHHNNYYNSHYFGPLTIYAYNALWTKHFELHTALPSIHNASQSRYYYLWSGNWESPIALMLS